MCFSYRNVTKIFEYLSISTKVFLSGVTFKPPPGEDSHEPPKF
jgi:hypothetical protein